MKKDMKKEKTKQKTNEKQEMDNKKDDSYVEAYIPDWKKLAELLEIAKGPDRTMAQFAYDCGKSPATFSRIVHAKNEKKLADKMIATIADHSADPVRANYDTFMRANGKIPREEVSEIKEKQGLDKQNEKKDRPSVLETMRKIKWDVRGIIVSELFSRDYMVGFSHNPYAVGLFPKSKYGLSINSSFSAKIDAQDINLWNFIVVIQENYVKLDKKTIEKMKERGSSAYLRGIMFHNAMLFLRDAWEPETLEGIRNSIVFTEEEYYDAFREKVFGLEFNTDISIILVDLDGKKVVKEEMLPRKDKKVLKSLFDKEVKTDSSDDDGDFGIVSDEENF